MPERRRRPDPVAVTAGCPPALAAARSVLEQHDVHGVELSAGSLFDLGPSMDVPYEDTVTGDLETQRFSLKLVPLARGTTGRLLIHLLRSVRS